MNKQRILVTSVMNPPAVLEVLSCVWHNPKLFNFLPSHTSSVIHYIIYELISNYHEIFCITFKVNTMSFPVT